MKPLFWIVLLSQLAACASHPGPAPTAKDSPVFDILVVGGTVYDGGLAAGVVGNIGIRDGYIATLHADADAKARTIIDASDLIVVPGFIDPHTHAGADLLDPERNSNLNYLMQGVTTVFIGNDGGGLPGGATVLASFENQGIGTNLAFFSGHGSIREAVMGRDDRAPNAAELTAMQERVAADMELGALGLSTGLYYVPGTYAGTDEVVALAKVAAAAGGVYDTHIRDESNYNIGVLGAIAETIEIAQRAAIPVNISHIKALGQDVWGQSADMIALIDAARAEGALVTANQYPWRASGTRLSAALIPRWALAGSKQEVANRLVDPDQGPRIRAAMSANLKRRGGPASQLITGPGSPYQGKSLSEIAAEQNVDPITVAVEIIMSEDPPIASFVMQEDDILRLAVQPWVMTGSDGSPGHPRKFATYPKAWQQLVTTGLLTTEQFVHRSSGQVAHTFGLCKRGYLKPGYSADIAIIDPAGFIANASYQAPTKLSAGVHYLIVNGVVAIDEQHYAGELPGQVLRHHGCDTSVARD
ncbi:MAG TPA: amidohydrolase family protein [Woeseiaceae bacterium]|nr:amidohydrolase family protein [Woeseiaceae bacterium]